MPRTGRPKVKDKMKFAVVVRFRRDEIEKLARLASADGCAVSAYLRKLAINRILVPGTSPTV